MKMANKYYGHPLRHDFIRDSIARNTHNYYNHISNKLQFLKHYEIVEVRTEFEVWRRLAKSIKLYSWKTKPEADGRLDIIIVLNGKGEKEGISRILCLEIKDGRFTKDDLLKYKRMENVFRNLPIIPGDSSEDPLLVLAWEENILLATDNDPDGFEREHNWSIRFLSLELFYNLLREDYKMVGRGLL